MNGTVACAFKTNDMIFGIQRFMAAMTRYLTLYPGDVIWMGTDGPPEHIRPGDLVRIEMRDAGGRSVFGAIEQRVIRYAGPPA